MRRSCPRMCVLAASGIILCLLLLVATTVDWTPSCLQCCFGRLSREATTHATANAIACDNTAATVYQSHATRESDLREQGWVLDCVTWAKKWPSTPYSGRLHQYAVSNRSAGEGTEKRRQTFVSIFQRRDWPAHDKSYDGLQSSGPGAMLRNAQGAVAALHSVVSRLKTHLGKKNISLLDAPCGDFQWMRKFVMSRDDVLYTGVDVVPELVAHNAATFGARLPRVRFLLADVVTDRALQAGYDLIFSRDMLQHMWMGDVSATLGTWSASGSRFLLTTNYPDTELNEEVQKQELGGRRSSYNLEMTPFSLLSPICSSYDWSIEHLALWSLPLTQKDAAVSHSGGPAV